MEMSRTADELSLLISPSRFLMEMLVGSQLVAREKIIFSDYGFETGGFVKAGQGVKQEGLLTLGFIGFDAQTAIVSGIGVHLVTNFAEYSLGIGSILVLLVPFLRERRRERKRAAS